MTTWTRLSRLLMVSALWMGAAACGDDASDGVPFDPDGGTVDAQVGEDMFRPDADAGTCVDGDEDGYGEGCSAGLDCDDTDPSVSPASLEVCNLVDDDCDGATDETVDAPSCELSEGVCAGAVARCGADGFLSCDATDYGADYEADETACDGLDNDCDGIQDEGCPCTEGDTQACGLDVGACMPGTQTCGADGMWGACEGDVGPMGESCDGLDNDCDGSADEPGELSAPDCTLQQGVCAGAKRACGGAAGWVACEGSVSYGADYEATEALCDGLDNDCDGVIDEGCGCIDGTTQACGSDVGVCMAGTQTCVAGTFGGCSGSVPAGTETCDGLDQDCDGATDETLVGPACALQVGVCAGATQRCAGAGGFMACDAAAYGSDYEATETSCDGVDNDCDGVLDEGCACVDGSTQPCGISTGACELGTQTCAAGAWGVCSGGVGPVAETCNGLDDDCDGISDDNLTAPACALVEGVCAGTAQTCGGAAGWQPCSGAGSYGASFLADETSLDEGHCDGLDNDCDGDADENCVAIPVVAPADDVVLPNLVHDHLVYMQNFDGNWDVVFQRFSTGVAVRLTSTAANEWRPKVYGNYVVFERGEDAASRVVLFDLVAGTETILSPLQSGSPTISGGAVLFDEFDGSDWEIQLHDIAAGTTGPLFSPELTGSNEVLPSLRGGTIAFISDAVVAGEWRVIAVDPETGTAEAQNPGMSSVVGQLDPVVDYATIAWSDGRDVTAATPDTTSDFDVYGAVFGAAPAFPGEQLLVGGAAAQLVDDADGTLFSYTDYAAGNANVGVVGLSGAPIPLSTHPGTQADATISGAFVMWEDNRRGNFDIYGTALSGFLAPAAGEVRINEVLFDPGTVTDANGDGTGSATQDEFIEVVNGTLGALDISGMVIRVGTTVRHTVPANTILPAVGSYVVFGGGTPTGLFAGAEVTTASTGGLSLTNSGATVTLALGAVTLDTMSYTASAADDQSVHREPAITGAFAAHSSIAGAVGRVSPGTGVSGFPY